MILTPMVIEAQALSEFHRIGGGVHWNGYQTRIGLTAAQDIPVHNEELYLRIKDEQAA